MDRHGGTETRRRGSQKTEVRSQKEKSVQHEVDAGLSLFSEIIGRGDRKLWIENVVPIFDRDLSRIKIRGKNGTTEIYLSGEFLSDLPNSEDYKTATYEYIYSLEQRLQNPLPSGFYCKSGIPLKLEIDWPLRDSGSHKWVHVNVHDLHRDRTVSISSIVIDGLTNLMDFKREPFQLEQRIINTVRTLADQERLKFFPEDAHPSQLPQFSLHVEKMVKSSEAVIRNFIMGKVYWLGFKQGDKNTNVWIADPWDAEYLGVEQKALKQAAQVLEAEQMLEMDQWSGDFASARRKLLLQARELETIGSEDDNSPDVQKGKTGRKWDLFICHASEDKEDFVGPLARALLEKETKVWYDEFALKIGDSLRRSIDRGLASSRYGVVVLSPSFFAKEWPQRELDGLVAKEIDGNKVILPVWHKVTREDVCNYSPPLADRVAAKSSEGIDTVVTKILEALREK